MRGSGRDWFLICVNKGEKWVFADKNRSGKKRESGRKGNYKARGKK